MLRQIITGASTLAFVTSAAIAQTYSSVLVTEAIVSGASPTSTSVDKITGYSLQRFSGIGELVGTAGTFNSSLIWQADGDRQGLYALYQANGTYSQTGASALFQFTNRGSFAMFLDTNLDTRLSLPMDSSTEWRPDNSSDDHLIAVGQATYCGVNCGAFIASIPITSTSFTLASPSGELVTFAPSWTLDIGSSFDVMFVNAVPEPHSMLLVGLGLGLVGFATTLRKSSKNKNA